MKSISCLFLLSTQLALNADKVLSLPIASSLDAIHQHHSSTWDGQRLQKRGGGGAREIQLVREPMTKTAYHAKAAKIAAEQFRNEFYHGPVRAALEVPFEGAVGAGKQYAKACKNAAECRPGKAIVNLAGASTKLAWAGMGAPLYHAHRGTARALPPLARMIYHGTNTSVYGANQKAETMLDGRPPKDTRYADKLDEMEQKGRSSKSKEKMDKVVQWAQSDHLRGPKKAPVRNYSVPNPKLPERYGYHGQLIEK